MLREEGTASPRIQRLECARRSGWLERNGQEASGRNEFRDTTKDQLVKSLEGHTRAQTQTQAPSPASHLFRFFVIVW